MTNPLLSGIRVLDLSRTVAAPLAAQMLGDFGAEVIKVERPGQGDEARSLGATSLKDRAGKPTREGSMYLSVNRNKRGITVDLTKRGGQELVRRLAAKSDVLIENYKVGDLARHGLDYASLKALNPRLIYCSVTGFGQTGPYRARAGYDPIFQAMAGWLSLNGIGDQPSIVNSNPCDMVSGYHAAMAILAALYHRDRVSGEGQHIDIALLDVAIAAYGGRALDYLCTGEQWPRMSTQGIIFPCSDGSIVVAAPNPRQWAAFCGILGLPELASDPRFADPASRSKNRPVLNPMLEAATRRFTVASLSQTLHQASIPNGPMYSYAQVFEDPQVKARGVAVEMPHPLAGTLRMVGNPIKFSATPVTEYRAPPVLGENTDEVLSGVLGLDARAIALLREEGAI